jgi:DNA-binding CsgD family transcriptional regulator/PAS domain-containing protein
MHAPVRSSDEAAEVSSLIGDIYDAALDTASWTSVLQKIGDFVGGPAAALYAKDTVRKSGNVFYQFGVEPKHVQSYFDKFVAYDPFTTTRFFFAIEQVISTTDVMTHDEYYATAFFKEWAGPQGWIDFVSASLDKSATTYAECGLFRHERNGVTDDLARDKMRLIIPHVRRAVLVGNVIEQHKVEAAAFADVLDGIATALVLVDAAGRIVHANAAALSLLEEETVVRGAGGRLMAIDAQASHVLSDIFNKSNVGDTAVGVKGVAVALPSRRGERYVAHVLPLTSGARRKAHVAYSAVAAVFIRKAALELPHPLEAIASTFKLTPAEMRVLMMVVQLGGVPEVAPVLGVSEATVKTHLQRIFAKTDTGRQADLVKLVAGYMSPLGGQPEQ